MAMDEACLRVDWVITTPESFWRAEFFSRGAVRGGIAGTLIIMLTGALYRRKYGG